MSYITQDAFLAHYKNPKKLPRAAFLTGGAGTGKTYCIRQLLRQLTAIEPEFPLALTAPTGVAALNLGGTTLHSFLHIPFNLRDGRSQAAYNAPNLSRVKRQTLQALKLLIIDEISMVRSDILNYVDELLRRVRGNSEPFGGCASLFVGDPYQLPPVVLQHEKLPEPWFFQSEAWLALDPETFILTENYRQNDPNFINLLNSARQGNISLEDLKLLGQQVHPQPISKQAVTLSTLNHIVNTINDEHLHELDATHTFLNKAIITLNTNAPSQLKPLRLVPAVEYLVLRPNARIMLLNNDTQNRWVNGSLGTYHKTQVSDKNISILHVTLDTGNEVLITPHTWELIDYEQRGDSWHKLSLATVCQYPIRLSWATTVHKAQGLSLSEVHFSLDYVFEAGQTYVALSRATTLSGLTLSKPLRNKHLQVCSAVQKFYGDLTLKIADKTC